LTTNTLNSPATLHTIAVSGTATSAKSKRARTD
jgi:hypothetical protein